MKAVKKVVPTGHFGVGKSSLIRRSAHGESNTMRISKKYLSGTHGVLYIFDLSREETYENLVIDIFEIQKITKGSPSVILANKSDLVDETLIEEFKRSLPIDFKVTNAKNGDQFEGSFLQLAKDML